ncbi:MAG: hypothetical protein ABFS10_03820 [Bacteroidota bacterium]
MNISEIQQAEAIWNYLEIAKLILATLAFIIIAILAFRFDRIIQHLNNRQTTNTTLAEKSINIYDSIVPKLYDILCFFSYIGEWTEITPVDIIKTKRELDKDVNIYTPLFSKELSKKYNDFIQLCFISFSGWEHDVKIKSLYELRQEHCPVWNDEWIQYFDTNNVVEATTMRERYTELIESFNKELVF